MGRADALEESQKAIMERVRRFVECASRRVKLVEAYLVGSRARGDYTIESDADVVLIVEGVENLNQKQRVMLLVDCAEPLVEYRVYTPREWREAESLWLRVLKQEAVRIYP